MIKRLVKGSSDGTNFKYSKINLPTCVTIVTIVLLKLGVLSELVKPLLIRMNKEWGLLKLQDWVPNLN